MPESALGGVDWPEAVKPLLDQGWSRLPALLPGALRVELAAAAPNAWSPVPEVEGKVRQAGLNSGVLFESAASMVQEFGHYLCESITSANVGVPPPLFNEVTWSKSNRGAHFVTAHRDPAGVGGVIAIATLWGRARFTVWDESQPMSWMTGDGDLVLLRGRGWPTEDARCPVHEVESPTSGDRMVMTLRYNRRGAGTPYFSTAR